MGWKTRFTWSAPVPLTATMVSRTLPPSPIPCIFMSSWPGGTNMSTAGRSWLGFGVVYQSRKTRHSASFSVRRKLYTTYACSSVCARQSVPCIFFCGGFIHDLAANGSLICRVCPTFTRGGKAVPCERQYREISFLNLDPRSHPVLSYPTASYPTAGQASV